MTIPAGRMSSSQPKNGRRKAELRVRRGWRLPGRSDKLAPMITLRSDQLEAVVAPLGAELQALRDATGCDWLWGGDPAFWSGRAPILFPIVGTLAEDRLRLGNESFTLLRHGFARRAMFEVVAQDAAAATFRLTATAETRAVYPFDFVLDVRFALTGLTLEIVATLGNPGKEPLPASFGFHPALRWPLPGSAAREGHAILFDQAEPEPIRRLDAAGLVAPERVASPVEGDRLMLDDALFTRDALIFERLASRGLSFVAPDGPSVRVDFPGMPQLGLWTKPGAGYLCIEPWQGHADPAGFAGDFRTKPGVIMVAPGAARDFTLALTLKS